MLRLAMLAALLCVSACVSDEVRDGARAACEAQHLPPEQMGACLDRMEGTLEAARAYRPPTEAPNRQ